MWPASMSLGKWRKNKVSSSTWMCGAVDVGVAQDADLAVAQPAHVRALSLGPCGSTPTATAMSWISLLANSTVALHLPGVEHLAAQRQDGLGLLVAAHLGAAAGGVAFHQEHLVEVEVAALAVGELARQHRDARALALFHLLAGALARLGLLDHELGELLAEVHVLVEPPAPAAASRRPTPGAVHRGCSAAP